MPNITTCSRCGKLYEACSNEEANSPNRLCLSCAYESGQLAREHGCYRVLCNYSSPAELRAWQDGWDAADRMAAAAQELLDWATSNEEPTTSN